MVLAPLPNYYAVQFITEILGQLVVEITVTTADPEMGYNGRVHSSIFSSAGLISGSGFTIG
jgi:hypothetical protein